MRQTLAHISADDNKCRVGKKLIMATIYALGRQYVPRVRHKLSPVTICVGTIYVATIVPHSRIFHSYGDVTITSVGQILTYICSALKWPVMVF